MHASIAIGFIRSINVTFEQRLNALRHASDIIVHVESRYLSREEKQRMIETREGSVPRMKSNNVLASSIVPSICSTTTSCSSPTNSTPERTIDFISPVSSSSEIDPMGLLPEDLMKMLRQLDVVSLVAGKGRKPALIERASRILKFVAEYGVLTIEEVARIWSSFQDTSKHESCVEAITNAFLELIPVLSAHYNPSGVGYVLDELQVRY